MINDSLKCSIYNHLFDVDGGKYIYNLLTTSIAQLDELTFNALNDNDIGKLEEQTLRALYQEGFLVDLDADEALNFQYFFDKSRYSSTADMFEIVFIPSYNCNLRCPYCYEGSKKSSNLITQEQIDALLKFVDKQIEQSKSLTPINEIVALLYGGEPMMSKRQLIYFCKGISDIADARNITINFDMVSNLTLLDDEMIEMIRHYNISVQVSIDGMKAEHDVRRILPNGTGTYDIIIANLERLISAGLKQNIIIRINTDYENLGQAEKLFEIMKKYSDDIYFGVLTTYKGYNDQYDKQCMETGCSNALLLDTHRIYQKNGLSIPQKFGKKGPCALNCENKFMVDCYLNVYKCDLLINHEDCKVGTIDMDGNIRYNANFYKQMNFSPFKYEKCRRCKFLPICAGGCPAKAYIDSQKKDASLDFNCEFDDDKLNAVLIDYILRRKQLGDK